jgi:hypothetical protein
MLARKCEFCQRCLLCTRIAAMHLAEREAFAAAVASTVYEGGGGPNGGVMGVMCIDLI